MFKIDIFKKATQKANKVIDKTAEDIGSVVKKADKLIDDGQSKLRLVAALLLVGVALGITADIISIAVGVKTLKSLRVENMKSVRKR